MSFIRTTTNRTTILDKRAVVGRIKSGASTALEEAARLDPPGTVEEISEWVRDHDAGELKRKVRRFRKVLATVAVILCAGAAQAQETTCRNHVCCTPGGRDPICESDPDNPPSLVGGQAVAVATQVDINAINKKLDWITRCLANKDGSLCSHPPK